MYWQICINHSLYHSVLLHHHSIGKYVLTTVSIPVFCCIYIVLVEYWQICIYPRRVEHWQSRARYPAHDAQLRSYSHQQIYKTQFIKSFMCRKFGQNLTKLHRIALEIVYMRAVVSNSVWQFFKQIWCRNLEMLQSI